MGSMIMSKVFQFEKTKDGKEIKLSKEIKHNGAMDATTVFGIIENEIEEFKMEQDRETAENQVQQHQGLQRQQAAWNQTWKGNGTKGRKKGSSGGKGRRGCFDMARNGWCKYGDNCKYSHEQDAIQKTREFMAQEYEAKGKGKGDKG